MNSSNLLFHINFLGCYVPVHMGPGAWQVLFPCRVQRIGICCHLGPGLCLQSAFTCVGLKLIGFNSIILLFVLNLSHVLSSHFSFFPLTSLLWVVFMIPFYIPRQFIRCNSFLWSGCIKIHGMHLYLASQSSSALLLYM